MAGKAPAYQMYAADFSMATLGWSSDEVCAHIRLMNAQWINDGLPDDFRELAGIAGLSLKKLMKVWYRLESRYPLCADGRRRNARLESERQKQQEYRDGCSRAGKASAQRRFNGRSTEASTEKQHSVLQSTTSTSSQKQKQEPREPFDGEMWMRAIFNAHPRPEWGQDAMVALWEAADDEIAEHEWTKTQACEYLMARAQLYAQCVKGWPRSELHKANGTRSFFKQKIYRQDDALWRREKENGNGKPNKATERFNSNVEAIARGFGLGDRAGDVTHGGELAELQHLPGNGGSLEGGVAQDRRPIRLLDAPGNGDAVHPRTGRLPPDAGKDP